MTWFGKIDEALGRLFRGLAIVIVVAGTLGILASVVLIVAGLFHVSPFLALGVVGVVSLVFYVARNTKGGPPGPGPPYDWH